jgi:hypothetical protein
MNQHTILSTMTYTSNGTLYSTPILQAEFGVHGPPRDERWYVCHMCNFSYPKSEVVLKGGVAFCIPRGHYKEMNDSRAGA